MKYWWIFGLIDTPYAYWQVHLGKVSGRKRDKALRIYYRNRAQLAEKEFLQAALTNQLTQTDRETYINWAFHMAATFHRASSTGRRSKWAFIFCPSGS